MFKEKKLITKTENSEYWLAVILTLIAFIFYPNPPSVSQAEGLTQQEKKEIKNLSYDAKLHCHVAVKMRLGDLDSSVSFPYTYRQLKDQTYVVNMRGKVENIYGGKTRKEWDCQIQYNGNGKTNKVENWEIEALEERDI